jgi:hypothetical protein
MMTPCSSVDVCPRDGEEGICLLPDDAAAGELAGVLKCKWISNIANHLSLNSGDSLPEYDWHRAPCDRADETHHAQTAETSS